MDRAVAAQAALATRGDHSRSVPLVGAVRSHRQQAGSGPQCAVRQVRALCVRGGAELRARLWQTLRASCEKEWAMILPQYAVSKWIGHSITVSGRHYANDVLDELSRKATGAGSQAQRKAQQKAHETSRNDSKEDATTGVADGRNSLDCENLRESSTSLTTRKTWRRRESNPRPEALQERFLRA